MKLDTSHMRYLTADDFKVLAAVEQGSRNHEVVPTSLIHNIGGLRSPSGTNRAISDLAKLSLVSRLRNAKYDGFRLTYNGFDYLALKGLLNRDTIYSVGAIIGVGKESDIYSVSDSQGNTLVMKIHRLGRTSFRTVKNNRDYLKKRQGASWMHLSKLAASKEYQFMGILYTNGFRVPHPYDCSRHCVVMDLIKGFPMRRLREHSNIPKLYSDLMKFAVKLANHGLIHCDFNEFNIMIKNEDALDGPDDEGFIVIDFPQCISIEHQDAEYYFKRDIDCIRRFFKKKLKYEPTKDSTFLDTDGYGDGYKYPYPVFSRDIERCSNLDVLVEASGYSKKKKDDAELEMAVQGMRDTIDSEDESGDDSEEDYDYDDYESEEESEEEEEEDDDENERIIEALSTGVGNLKMDKMGNYILE